MLAETPHSFKTRLESAKGANPEDLIAAAHAGCFTVALAFRLQGAGRTPAKLDTEAAKHFGARGSRIPHHSAGFDPTRTAEPGPSCVRSIGR